MACLLLLRGAGSVRHEEDDEDGVRVDMGREDEEDELPLFVGNAEALATGTFSDKIESPKLFLVRF